MRNMQLFVLCALVLSMAGACRGKDDKDAKKDTPENATAAAPEDGKGGDKNGLSEQEAAQVLAKVGDSEITLGQFADRLGSQSPYLRARYNSPERRQEFLDNMVRFELLAIEARKRGLDKRPEVERVQRQMMVQQMMTEMFDEQGIKLSDITDAEISAYYNEHKDEFQKPAQRRASHILRKDKESAQKILDQLLAKNGDMQLFRKLAQEKNLDPMTKVRYGDLRFFAQDASKDSEDANAIVDEEEEEAAAAQPKKPGAKKEAGPRLGGGPPKAVRDAAFELEKTGDMYPKVIQSELGFHVLKLTGQRAALERSMEDARRLIQNRLWRERREAAIEKFVGELRAKANVKEDLNLLDQVKVDLQAPGPEEAQEAELKKLPEPTPTKPTKSQAAAKGTAEKKQPEPAPTPAPAAEPKAAP